jgi:hypothetical protein
VLLHSGFSDPFKTKSQFVAHRRPSRSRLSHTRPKCAVPSQTTFLCSIPLLTATTNILHSPSKVHHTLCKLPSLRRILLQKLFVTLAATMPAVLACIEDVQGAATAIALAGDGQNASPTIGTVAEALADGGFERGGPGRSDPWSSSRVRWGRGLGTCSVARRSSRLERLVRRGREVCRWRAAWSGLQVS